MTQNQIYFWGYSDKNKKGFVELQKGQLIILKRDDIKKLGLEVLTKVKTRAGKDDTYWSPLLVPEVVCGKFSGIYIEGDGRASIKLQAYVETQTANLWLRLPKRVEPESPYFTLLVCEERKLLDYLATAGLHLMKIH